MSETLQFQCQSCGHVVERPRNPRTCPKCGKTVMRPAELSEPGQQTHEMKTEDFDVSDALSRLENNRPEAADGRETDTDEAKHEPTNAEEPGLLRRLLNLF